MSQQHEKLSQALAQLQTQLEEIRQIDPAVAERLQGTLAQAQAALAGERPAEPHTLSEQLRDTVLEYEASHPRLATTLGSVIDALGQMGI